jgi:hypothetical protein|tara:strand:+ start:262 stop:588 length:327 start_codon:yes stop_codon:yes gene_type:complete
MKKYSDDELKWIYRDWKESRLSQKAYCQKYRIKPNLFKGDLYHLRKREQEKAQRAGKFHVVQVPEIARNEKVAPYCEILFSGSHKVSFSDKESLLGLRTLIRELMQAS